MIEVREYLGPNGGRPLADWFTGLNSKAAAKVATALTRLAAGQLLERQGRRFGCLRVQNRLRAGLSRSCKLAGLQTEKEGGQLWR